MEVRHDRDDYEGKLSDLLAVVRDTFVRRWKTFVLILLAVLLAAVAAVYSMTPRYEATARVQIDPSRNPLAKNGGGKSEELSPESIETEVSVIKSMDIARKVAAKLKLENDPEFAAGLDKQVGMSAEDRNAAVAGRLLGNLSVGREKLTYIIAIGMRSRDPSKAMRIANAFADLYLETKVDSVTGAARSQVEWFRARLEKLQAEVREADAKVAQYRVAAGIVGSNASGAGGGTIADQQVGPLSGQLATAESVAAAAQATLTAAQSQAARGGLDAVTEVRSSPVVGELRRQRAELLRNIGEIQARYGDKHPESVRIRGQLETVDRQIREEGERVLGSLKSNAAAAQAQVASLRASMGRLEGQRATDMRAAVQADSLERESEAKRAEYERLSQMLLESSQASQNSIAQATIVERAETPQSPSSPNKPMFIMLGLLVGLAAGAGTIATQEMMVTGLRSGAEVEEQLGLRLLAAAPKVEKGIEPIDLLIDKPTSIYAEAFRIARAAILGTRGDNPAKTIAFTSALPNEGKTTSAVSFARSLAISNIKTLLIECDVRRAAVSPMLGLPHGGSDGLVELLQGKTTLAEVVKPSGVENLDHILVSEPYFSSEDLFGGDRMSSQLAALATKYDRIVLDLPPLIGLADGRFLSGLADTVVIVVKWDATPAKAVVNAVDYLRADGAKLSGVIFTMVDQSSQQLGSYYYSKEYGKYYQER